MEDKNKLQEEIIKADLRNDEKMWKSLDEACTLNSFLEKMTKDELVKIAKKYSVKGITTLKKAAAVEKIKDVVLTKANIALESMEENTLKFVEELIKVNGLKKYKFDEVIYINYLRNRGLAFSGIKDEEAFVVMPEELKEVISKQLNKEVRDKARLNGEIIKAMAGMVYYYGVCNFDLVKANLENIFGKTFEESHLNGLIANGEELGYDYVIEEKLLCHIDVEDVEGVLQLQEKAENDYYKFDKKSLIKAGRIDFVEENKQGAKIEKVLGEVFVIDKNILKDEIVGFIVAIKNEMEMQEAIDNFLEAYEIQSDEERNIFVHELELFAKSIRKWSLKGYTQDEVEKLKARVVNTVKIGRNDPCICGSGKKYKKCCG